MTIRPSSYSSGPQREMREQQILEDRRKQAGIAFPSAKKQHHILIIRLDLAPNVSKDKVQSGLTSLCKIFDNIYTEKQKIEVLQDDGDIVRSPLKKFRFTVTIGFGAPFFDKLSIPEWNRPRNLRTMPDHLELRDPFPYSLRQTDLIIQLASSSDFVNRWVYEYSYDTINYYLNDLAETDPVCVEMGRAEPKPIDIVTAIKGWALVTDLHVGFQRLDGRNLLGFNDGVSNPNRLELDDIVWTNQTDECESLADGTYMVFQKIEHDLNAWRSLTEEKQQEIVGRSKGTGLLLGTLSKDDDDRLAMEMRSDDNNTRIQARTRLKELLVMQRDPKTNFFDPTNESFKGIQDKCPVWSHVRKANPRQADGTSARIIYRRGYLFSDVGPAPSFHSGLLFICFQRKIQEGFEFIKKNWLNNRNFPVPEARHYYTERELAKRHYHGRFTLDEIKCLSLEQRSALGLVGETFDMAVREAQDEDTQNTGREGLSGPSELGVNPLPLFFAATPLGGGYYFVPPIPNRQISLIGQSFFENML
jgi:Dyp-type peroxidase family